MKRNKKILSLLFTIVFVILAACGNSSDEANSMSDNNSVNNNTDQSVNDDFSNTESIDNFSDGENNPNKQTDTGNSDKPSKIEDEEVSESSDKTVNKKEEYLEKLNDLEKELQGKPEDGTQLEMEQTQKEIFTRWDDALNEVYSVLEEQLSTSEMDELREEQRNWIKQRDEIAEEEASQFKGGSMESLTYVTTQTRITKERCFELVEDYMK